MAALQLFGTLSRNHDHHHLKPSRRDSSPLFPSLTEPSTTVYAELAGSVPLDQPQEIDREKQAHNGLSAGTIVAIIFSGLILIFLLTGAYTCASSPHKSKRDRRSTLARRSHYYQDDDVVDDNDIEMQAQRNRRKTQLWRLDEDQSTGQQQYHSYHCDGAGMGYDDEDGKEAWIEVGTARVARIRRVPSGSVSIRNIGRSKASVPLGSSQTVRDVGSLPDLAWAETLTTGGGRRPGVVVSASPPAAAAAAARPPPPSATRASSKSSSSERSKKLQERSESRRAVKRKAIREWCARGSGGGLGPYSAAY